MIFDDLKKVPHHRTPQSREGLAADGYNFALVPLAVAEDNPKQNIESLPGSGASLLNYYFSRGGFKLLKYFVGS